ncbi:recombinase family protein [Terrihabitans rhizophilus]|uniref:Recombinase family protein n=1 Tax=Terrihabitans rhizophilus TaxID=3092662 RepID=A0ABU4RMV1_9HYPH|nr:recombinase family protein [Terrihabitans sp. PJ23]MDX6806150.1 recombinase family protein [Terrihabitans sp. PJ23]
MIIGYARVSTDDQDLTSQVERLRAAGCEKIFSEKLSGKNANRAQLLKMLGGLSAGDVVLATVTDRIARDPLDMLNILNTVKAAGAGLRLLDEPFLDTSNDLSDIVIFIVGWAAKWHRRRILENTARGRARAQANGTKFGRKSKLTPHQQREALDRLAKGFETQREIALSYNVSHPTIGRLRSKRDRPEL